MLEMVRKAHKTEIFWKCSHSNFFRIFQKFYIMCAFQSFSSIFLFFANFWNFIKSLPMRCMPASVNATACLCRTRSLSHAVADCLGVYVKWPLQDSLCGRPSLPVSICDLRGVCCTLAFNRSHVRDRVRQRPRSSDTVHKKQFDRHRYFKVGRILKEIWKNSKIVEK
jgi:hypothetical protein